MSRVIFEKKLPCGLFQTWDDKPPFDCFHVHQVHGIDYLSEDEAGQADGIYGKQTKPWAIKTADCMPVVISGERGFVFFHAGWRGLADKIHLHDKVKALNPNYAFIGPHICAENFEVGEDFKQHFPSSRNFLPHKSGKQSFNLLAELTEGLQRAYSGITVEDSKLCTYDRKDLHSYRLDKTPKRNWNVFSGNDLKLYTS